MGEVIEINQDTLEYIKDGKDRIVGVADSSGEIDFMSYGEKVSVLTSHTITHIDKVKFKELCVAWLALNYPESLKFDEES